MRQRGRARDFRDEIKFLSYADFRQINLGFAVFQSGGKYAIGCGADHEVISDTKRYIQDLKNRVNAKNKTTTSSSTTSNKKLIYCKRPDGTVYSTYNKKCNSSNKWISKFEYDKIIKLSKNNSGKTYCRKLNGDIYETKRKYCTTTERVSSKQEYDRSLNKSQKSTTLRYCKLKNGSTYSTYKKCGYKEEITKKEYDRLNSVGITKKKLYCKNSDGEAFQMSYGNKCGFSLQEITETEYEKIISGKKTASSLDCSAIPDAELMTPANLAACPAEIALRELERNKKTTSKGLKYCLGKNGTYSTFKTCSLLSREITRQEYDSINNQPTFSIVSMLKDLRGEEVNHYYTTANVRIRSQASTDSSILTTVPAGEVVNVHNMLTSDNNWWLVEFNKIVGYMDKSYLSRDKMSNDSEIIDEKPINGQEYNESDIFKERLKDLKELFDLGLITQQEYDQKKQSILDLL